MIAELGNYALALSLAIAILLAIFPLWGAETRRREAGRGCRVISLTILCEPIGAKNKSTDFALAA